MINSEMNEPPFTINHSPLKNVPQIRFKGFNGSWDERPFNHITTRSTQAFDEEHLPRLEYEDIISGSGLLNKDLTRKVSHKKGIKFEVNDVLFGKLRPYLRNWIFADFSGVAVGDFWVLKARDTAPLFLYTLIQTNKFEMIANQSAGSKMPRSDWNLVSNSCYFVSPIFMEQQKIGAYFKELDQLIQQHQHKHDKLVTLKQAMLQKMFPQPGTTTPEIRFKGFEGEWVKHSLKNFADITTGFPFKSSDFSDSGAYLVVTNGNIQNELTFVDSAVGNRINIQNSSGLNQFILRVGDILVTMDGSVGRTAKVRETNQILAQRVGRLVAKSDAEFLYQALNTGEFLKEMTSISHGGTIKHISLSEIGDYIFLAPSDLAEQQKIGLYFRQLDELIARHASQLEKLKQVKAACLEKMFV